MPTPILIEPEAALAERHAYVRQDVFAYTAADPVIFGQLQGGPMRLMTLLNVTARLMPFRSKRQKLAIKHEVLMRLTSLIRGRQLKRLKRKFVSLPTFGL
jgi:hypothetical protein